MIMLIAGGYGVVNLDAQTALYGGVSTEASNGQVQSNPGVTSSARSLGSLGSFVGCYSVHKNVWANTSNARNDENVLTHSGGDPYLKDYYVGDSGGDVMDYILLNCIDGGGGNLYTSAGTPFYPYSLFGEGGYPRASVVFLSSWTGVFVFLSTLVALISSCGKSKGWKVVVSMMIAMTTALLVVNVTQFLGSIAPTAAQFHDCEGLSDTDYSGGNAACVANGAVPLPNFGSTLPACVTLITPAPGASLTPQEVQANDYTLYTAPKPGCVRDIQGNNKDTLAEEFLVAAAVYAAGIGTGLSAMVFLFLAFGCFYEEMVTKKTIMMVLNKQAGAAAGTPSAGTYAPMGASTGNAPRFTGGGGGAIPHGGYVPPQ